MARILTRFEPPWPPSLDCGRGWFGLLCELDEQLSAIAPGYVLHQVKEKFGTLRFYWALPHTPPPCCTGLEESGQRPDVLTDERSNERAAHLADRQHARHVEQIRVLEARADEIVAGIEDRSERVCELTGKPGVLMVNSSGWYQTRDPLCAPSGWDIVFDRFKMDWNWFAGDDQRLLARLAYLKRSEAHLSSIVASVQRTESSTADAPAAEETAAPPGLESLDEAGRLALLDAATGRVAALVDVLRAWRKQHATPEE